jgi:hypothetical protein
MPGAPANRTARLAEALAIEAARERDVSICKQCGQASMQESPVRCSRCGAGDFEVVTEEMLANLAKSEGGLAREKTYDGRELCWSRDAKRALRTLKDAGLRRRAKARIEKSARTAKRNTITLELARRIVEDETGAPLVLPEAPAVERPPAERPGLVLVARDENDNPLYSRVAWTREAVERIFRVPVGVMRKRLQERAERLVGERGLSRVELALVEEGIDEGRREMEEFIRDQEAESRSAAAVAGDEESTATVSGTADQGTAEDEPARDGFYLNEFGVLQALDAKRKRD